MQIYQYKDSNGFVAFFFNPITVGGAPLFFILRGSKYVALFRKSSCNFSQIYFADILLPLAKNICRQYSTG